MLLPGVQQVLIYNSRAHSKSARMSMINPPTAYCYVRSFPCLFDNLNYDSVAEYSTCNLQKHKLDAWLFVGLTYMIHVFHLFLSL